MAAWLAAQVPKILLFTDKEATPRMFAALAANMRNRSMLFADVHTSQSAVLEQFGVKKVRLGMVAWSSPETVSGLSAAVQRCMGYSR